jgi:ATP-dependent helicase/nuclease subunit B
MAHSSVVASIAQAVGNHRPEQVALVVRSADMAVRARREVLSMTESGAALVIPIYTFDQYAAAILRRAGGRPRSRPIGELEREIAIGRLLKERAGSGQLAALGHSADRPGVVRAFAGAITEMKQAAATPDQAEQALTGGSAPAGVHADFLAVWRDYEDFLEAHGLADGEDLYADAARALGTHGRQALGDLERVWFDQFFDTTPAEAALISAVARLVPATFVGLACAQCDDADFVVERVRRMVEPATVEVSRRGEPSGPRLSIMTAPGPAAEAREVAREVKRLIVEEGCRPWEICIASADSAEFIPALLEAFDEFGVACAAPRKRLLSSSMLVLDCVALADATASRHNGFDLARLLASPYIGHGPACAAQAARAIGVKGLELTAGRWKARLRGIDECGDALTLVETLAEAWSGGFGKSGGLADRVCEFRALLATVGMPGSIMASDNRDWAVEAWAAWKAFNSLLDEIARSAGDGEAGGDGSWAEFARILGSAIRRRSFPLERPDPAGVKVVGPARGAESGWPVLFLSGMAEGTFPRRMRRPWVFKEDDLERLARSGIGVMLPGEHAAMERFIFSSAVGAASRRLYITYPSSATDGSSVRRSFFVDELLDSMGLAPEDERRITVSVSPSDVFPRRLDMAASPRELTLCALALARAHEQAGQLMPEVREWTRQRPDMWEVASWWKDRSAQGLGPGFSVYSGAVGAPDLVKSLRTKMLRGAVWSAGHFDDYLRCPFAFFCSRVLRLDAVEEAPEEPTPLTRGGVLHDILRRFFERRLGSCLVPSKIDDYYSEMASIAQEELDKIDIEAISMSGQAWEAYRSSIVAQAIQTLDAQVELACKTDGFWSPAHLEWSFGLALRPEAAPSSVREYLVLSGDGLSHDRAAAPGDVEDEAGGIGGLRVCGRVDRIDVGPDGALAIYDYKSGRSANLPKFTEIKEADEVQLGVYVLAVERLLASSSQPVAGAWYYSLRDSSMASGVWREEYHDRFAAERRRGGKLSGEEWREYVGRVRARALEVAGRAAAGEFHIAPRKPSSCAWCDYRRVCQVYMLDLEALSQSAEGDGDTSTGGDCRG